MKNILRKKYDVNKNFLYWNCFERFHNWSIIKLVTTSKNNTKEDDEAFGAILKGVETRISEKLLNTMSDAMKTDEESTNIYYVVQWTSEPYILQEDKETKAYIQLVTAYVCEVLCDDVL